MNRHRSEAPRQHFSAYLSLIAGAIVAAGGGITYAYFMNRQLETTREIARIESRIKERQLEIATTRMRIDEATNRYTIKEYLARQHSPLKSIPRGTTEDVRPASQPRAVAYTP